MSPGPTSPSAPLEAVLPVVQVERGRRSPAHDEFAGARPAWADSVRSVSPLDPCSESSFHDRGHPDGVAPPPIFASKVSCSRSTFSTRGRPPTRRSRNAAFKPGSIIFSLPSVGRLELALTGELDLAQIDPIAKPLAKGREIERGGHDDAAIEVSLAGRRQKARLDVEPFQLRRRVVDARVSRPASPAPTASSVFSPSRAARSATLPVTFQSSVCPSGSSRDVRAKSGASALDAKIVAQVQGRRQLPGHGSQVDRRLQPRTLLGRGRDRALTLKRHDRAGHIELVDRPGAVASVQAQSSARGLEVNRVGRKGIADRDQIRDGCIAVDPHASGLNLTVKISGQLSSSLDQRIRQRPGPPRSLERKVSGRAGPTDRHPPGCKFPRSAMPAGLRRLLEFERAGCSR